jgi:hypothetical protein
MRIACRTLPSYGLTGHRDTHENIATSDDATRATTYQELSADTKSWLPEKFWGIDA